MSPVSQAARRSVSPVTPRSNHACRMCAMGSTDDAFEALLREAAHVTDIPLAVAGRPLADGDSLCDGRFVVRSRLGRGGSGIVYDAEDRARGCRIALKMLHVATAAWLRRIRAEFVALT